QTGVGYHRPERKHGRSHHDWGSNVRWARECLLSLGTRLPGLLRRLHAALLLGVAPGAVVAWHTDQPARVWAVLGMTLLSCHSLNHLFHTERIEQIFREVKRRPRFIRSYRIQNGIRRTWD